MKWYAKHNSNGQGLVIDESTGENIAVSYKAENASLIAATPEAIGLLTDVLDMLNNMTSEDFSIGMDKPIRKKIESFLYNLNE
jgi:hypothetical protein